MIYYVVSEAKRFLLLMHPAHNVESTLPLEAEWATRHAGVQEEAGTTPQAS